MLLGVPWQCAQAGPQLTLDSENKCPHGLPSRIADFTAIEPFIQHLGQREHVVMVYPELGLGYPGLPQNIQATEPSGQGTSQIGWFCLGSHRR